MWCIAQWPAIWASCSRVWASSNELLWAYSWKVRTKRKLHGRLCAPKKLWFVYWFISSGDITSRKIRWRCTCGNYSRRWITCTGKINLHMELVLRHPIINLCHVFRNGIFHRDIKPENVLILDDVLKVLIWMMRSSRSLNRPSWLLNANAYTRWPILDHAEAFIRNRSFQPFSGFNIAMKPRGYTYFVYMLLKYIWFVALLFFAAFYGIHQHSMVPCPWVFTYRRLLRL